MAPRKGRTLSGLEFSVPRTPDLVETLLNPRQWGPAELIAGVICLLVPIHVLFVGQILPLWLSVVSFLFWRIAYNLGLGMLLLLQSENQFLTHIVADASPSTRALFNWIATRSLPSKHSWNTAPSELNAWLLFRAIALVVLVGDGSTYISLVLGCFQRPSSLLLFFMSSIIGFLLIWFSVWAKKKAHDALGDYAWYWGDFFFTQDNELRTDGIFAVAPHPMYTLGYLAYYGAALVTRSHILLAVSLVAHAMQIAFLIFVEEPHMEKLYNKPIANGETSRKTSTSSTEITPVPPAKTPADELTKVLANPALLPVAIISILVGFTLLTNPNVYLVLIFTIFSHIAHWTLLGLVLTQQSISETWTRTLAREGIDARSAFQRWRSLYILSHSVNRAMIIALTFCMSPPHDSAWLLFPSSAACSRIALSTALLILSIFGTRNACNNLGDFGTCYGDFFLPPKKELQYNGIFSYMIHPLCVTEYLAYYSAAVYRRSWILAVIAVFAQVANVTFVVCVERPHIKRRYKRVRERSNIVLFAGDLASSFIDLLPRAIGSAITNIFGEEEKVRGKAMAKLCQGAALGCEKVVKAMKWTENVGNPVSVSSASQVVTEATISQSRSVDSGKVVQWLRKQGMKIEEIPDSKVDQSETSHSIKQE